MPPALLLAAALLAPPEAETLTPGEWPMFRGPNGSGIGADPLPADLIREENLVWKVEVPGRGWGSPVVADGPEGKTVYVPTAAPDGREMSVLAYGLATGDRRWTRVLFTPEEPDFCHPTNTYASCTPVATAEAVFAHFGKYGTARLDPADGHTVWERRDLECDHFRGPASSPLLVQGEGITPRLVIPFDGIDEQYVVALDAATGETLWRYDRPGLDGLIPDKRKAYGTPMLATSRERPAVITTGAAETAALDPASGAPLWRVDHGGMNSGSVPQELAPPNGGATGLLVTTGDAPTAAVLLDADPDARRPRFGKRWETVRAVPRRSTPLVLRGVPLSFGDDGIAALHAPLDGSISGRTRLDDSFWSSPVAAGETVFICGKGGAAFAFDLAAERFAPTNVAALDDGVWATPALAGGGLVLRTEHTLRFYKPGGTNK